MNLPITDISSYLAISASNWKLAKLGSVSNNVAYVRFAAAEMSFGFKLEEYGRDNNPRYLESVVIVRIH